MFGRKKNDLLAGNRDLFVVRRAGCADARADVDKGTPQSSRKIVPFSKWLTQACAFEPWCSHERAARERRQRTRDRSEWFYWLLTCRVHRV